MRGTLNWRSVRDAEIWIDNGWTNAGYEWDSPRQREDIIRAAWYYYNNGTHTGRTIRSIHNAQQQAEIMSMLVGKLISSGGF